MDERIQKYEEKMKKTLGSLEAGGKYHGSGSSYDPDPAMGIQPDQGN